jgi:hypothetical protein
MRRAGEETVCRRMHKAAGEVADGQSIGSQDLFLGFTKWHSNIPSVSRIGVAEVAVATSG